jgi:hypothetical protein
MELHGLVLRHPSSHVLMAYAEALADGRPIPADVARHVAKCRRCRRETASMGASLRVAAKASGDAALEPSGELTARILQRARSVRVEEAHARPALRLAVAARVAACAAMVVAVAALTWQVALGDSPGAAPAAQAAGPSEPVWMAPGPSPEALRRSTLEMRAFAENVLAQDDLPSDARSLEKRREALARDVELQAALAALERNPAHADARRVVNGYLNRNAEAWKALWLEQSL